MNQSIGQPIRSFDRVAMILFALTIFLSAYLLFQVQPLISKLILPWFGGSPTVWTTAMLFFQCILFFGYAYSHGISRNLSVKQQTLAQAILLIIAACLSIFVVPGERFKPTGDENPIWHILVLLICFMCHGELVRLRPKSPEYLTEFYLWMSFGGACGGLFVTLVATNFFADYYEWFMCLVAGLGTSLCIIAQSVRPKNHSTFGTSRGWYTAAAVLFVPMGSALYYWEDPFRQKRQASEEYNETRLHQSRNFYGAVSVKDLRHRTDPSENYRIFYSGQITHGLQFTHPDRRTTPAAYHSIQSGIGETLEYAKSKNSSIRVAVVGLGAGTLANYARELDHYDFYEINPDVIRIANEEFDNLSLCKATPKNTILGDARLKLEQLGSDVQYDLIALDAFSGGSVPIHLLTKEAFAVYRRHLKPDGFIAANITNGYLNLYPVVKRQAEHLGMGFRYKVHAPDSSRRIRRSKYFILTEDQEYLRLFPSVNRQYYDDQGNFIREENPEIPNVPLWTDHFSSINAIELRD